MSPRWVMLGRSDRHDGDAAGPLLGRCGDCGRRASVGDWIENSDWSADVLTRAVRTAAVNTV